MSYYSLKFASLFTSWRVNPLRAIAEIEALKIRPVKRFSSDEGGKTFRVATAKIPQLPTQNSALYLAALDELFASANKDGASILAFPQLFALTMLPLAIGGKKQLSLITNPNNPHLKEDFQAYMQSLGDWHYAMYLNIFRHFAKEYQMAVVAGSIFVRESGRYYNRSYVFDRTGEVIGVQDKLFLTNYEKQLELTSGSAIHAISVENTKLSILNDNDIFFFENSKIAAHQGAELLFSSHLTMEDRVFARFQEALSWRTEEQRVYGVQSCYDTTHWQSTCGFFAPASLSEEYTGTLASSQKTGVLTLPLNLERIHKYFDPYTSDQNPQLCKNYSSKVYGFPSENTSC